MQNSLRARLRERIKGADVEEVRPQLVPSSFLVGSAQL